MIDDENYNDCNRISPEEPQKNTKHSEEDYNLNNVFISILAVIFTVCLLSTYDYKGDWLYLLCISLLIYIVISFALWIISNIGAGILWLIIKKRSNLKLLSFVISPALVVLSAFIIIVGYQVSHGRQSSSNNSVDNHQSITLNEINDPDTNNNLHGQELTATYILNTSTKKFHRSTCSYAKRISPENYDTIGSRTDAINAGYSPCKKCNP